MSEDIHGKYIDEAVTSTAQTITGSFANLGSKMSMKGSKNGAIWPVIDINSSTGVQFRVLAYRSTTGTAFILPIATVSATSVSLDYEVIDIANNLDQNLIYMFKTEKVIPYIQIQVKATGGSGGQITSCALTRDQG